MSHKPYSVLNQELTEAAKGQIKIGGKYYHWKDPNFIYEVIGLGFLEWSGEIAVTYKPVDENVVWIRRLNGKDGWLTSVEREGEDKRRFIPAE